MLWRIDLWNNSDTLFRVEGGEGVGCDIFITSKKIDPVSEIFWLSVNFL